MRHTRRSGPASPSVFACGGIVAGRVGLSTSGGSGALARPSPFSLRNAPAKRVAQEREVLMGERVADKGNGPTDRETVPVGSELPDRERGRRWTLAGLTLFAIGCIAAGVAVGAQARRPGQLAPGRVRPAVTAQARLAA